MADNSLGCVHVVVGFAFIYTCNHDVSPMNSEFDVTTTLMYPVFIIPIDIVVCYRHQIIPVVFIYQVVVHHSFEVIVGWSDTLLTNDRYLFQIDHGTG